MTSLKNIGYLSQLATLAQSLSEMATSMASGIDALHQADLDLLRTKALRIYENVLMLKADIENDALPKQAAAEKQSAQPTAVAGASDENPALPRPKPFMQIKDDASQVQQSHAHTTYPVENPQQDQKHTPLIDKSQPADSKMDLFTQNTVPLADKLAAQPDNSLAARLGRSPISDLRKAIGINDKFLFINELFEGNIQQYNHAIDELDGFKSYNGAKTYLIELSVLHGWDPDSPATKKLHELIDRKFEQA